MPPAVGSIGEPLVSVIVPVHNGAAVLADTLHSALQQTYRRLEVIVVDDGSRDATRSIAESVAVRDSRVRVVAQANRGVAAARNRALTLATGELIAPLDADDLWDPSKIGRQVRRMLAGGDEVGLVYCWWLWIAEDGLVLDASPRWRIEGRAADLLLQVNYIGNASVPLFRRRTLEEVGGYDETLRARNAEGCEDWDVSLKIAERAAVAVEPAHLVAYRTRHGAMSARTDTMWRSHRLMLAAARTRRPATAPALIRRSDRQFALYLAGVAFRARQHLQTCRWGARAGLSALSLWAIPYIARALGRAALRGDVRSTARIRPGEPFNERDVPPSLIPYDRFYARHITGGG